MDQFACSKGTPSRFNDTATRRTKGESNMPISSIQRDSTLTNLRYGSVDHLLAKIIAGSSRPNSRGKIMHRTVIRSVLLAPTAAGMMALFAAPLLAAPAHPMTELTPVV